MDWWRRRQQLRDERRRENLRRVADHELRAAREFYDHFDGERSRRIAINMPKNVGAFGNLMPLHNRVLGEFLDVQDALELNEITGRAALMGASVDVGLERLWRWRWTHEFDRAAVRVGSGRGVEMHRADDLYKIAHYRTMNQVVGDRRFTRLVAVPLSGDPFFVLMAVSAEDSVAIYGSCYGMFDGFLDEEFAPG